MKLALGSKFGFGKVDVAAGAGYRSESSTTQMSQFENETFNTVVSPIQSHILCVWLMCLVFSPFVGRYYRVSNAFSFQRYTVLIRVWHRENDVTRWKASLGNHANWSVTRTLRVESVIDLFDEDMQARIIAAAPQLKPDVIEPIIVPFHGYSIKSSFGIDHFYTVDTKKDHDVWASWHWRYDIIANVFSSPASGAVPLWRLVRKEGTHVYTVEPIERQRYIAAGGRNEGVACYVYTSPGHPGTVPLLRLISEDGNNYRYTTSRDEMNKWIGSPYNYRYVRDEAYVYPPTPDQVAKGHGDSNDSYAHQPRSMKFSSRELVSLEFPRCGCTA